MALTTLEVLRGARELLSEPERWTKDAGARDAKGAPCGWDAEDASCWCLDGALCRLAYRNNAAAYQEAGAALRKFVLDDYDSYVDFNDSRTHSEVLALLDRAIAAEEALGV